MVNQKGQSVSEFMIVMLALLMFGLFLTYTLGNGQGGAGAVAQQNATTAIAKD